ncbi:MAG: 50S ribosomal protein L22 [Cytophagales bacterium]|nr:MAG: 50S ribosomal protein L22 [Cytophagales bacterium]
METVIKQRKSVIRRQKKQAESVAKKNGPVNVKLINVPTSTRKMRLVADLIRGLEVNKALAVLKFQSKSGAPRLEKLLLSAMASWELTHGQIDQYELIVSEIFVDGGAIMKRLRPAPQGRAHRVRKRSNHVSLQISSIGGKTIEKSSVVTDAEIIEEKVEAKTTKTKVVKTPVAKTTKSKKA